VRRRQGTESGTLIVMVRRVGLFTLAFAVLPACSSGSSGSSGTSTGVDCSFSGSLTGGVMGTVQANGCGTSTSATFSIAQADITTGTSLGVKFELVTALEGGELGTIPLKSFEVFQREGKPTTSLVWSSTSCTLTLDRNEASPTTVFKNRFLLSGSGSCAASLEATAPNTRPPVTVTAFSMTAFVDPR